MKTNGRSRHLVPALAVASVTLAALAAAWLSPEDGEAVADERPALEVPVQVVRAPAGALLNQPVSCRDCGQPAAPTGRY